MEVINGALLGDGMIEKKQPHPKKHNSNFKYCSSMKQHVIFISSFFKNILTDGTKNTAEYSYTDKRTNKTYHNFNIRTKTDILFTNLRKKWYPNHIKIIPNDLILTPLSCLIWYIGDGHLFNQNNRTNEIRLCTNNFKKSDLEKIIIPQLSKFNAYIRKKDKDYMFETIIPRLEVKNFLEYIGNSPFIEMNYKWNYILNMETKFPKELIDKFLEAYNNGESYCSIAKRFCFDPAGIRYQLIKNGVYKK